MHHAAAEFGVRCIVRIHVERTEVAAEFGAFEQDLKVTIQALGWRSGWRYLPLQDDIASVAYWYQTLPARPFPKLPSKDCLEVI